MVLDRNSKQSGLSTDFRKPFPEWGHWVTLGRESNSFSAVGMGCHCPVFTLLCHSSHEKSQAQFDAPGCICLLAWVLSSLTSPPLLAVAVWPLLGWLHLVPAAFFGMYCFWHRQDLWSLLQLRIHLHSSVHSPLGSFMQEIFTCFKLTGLSG